jgi:Zn finger protein HypA/HybF involved in hydrogenase expression
MKPNCECSNCHAKFKVTGFNMVLVLTGGADCPNCGGINKLNTLIAERQK